MQGYPPPPGGAFNQSYAPPGAGAYPPPGQQVYAQQTYAQQGYAQPGVGVQQFPNPGAQMYARPGVQQMGAPSAPMYAQPGMQQLPGPGAQVYAQGVQPYRPGVYGAPQQQVFPQAQFSQMQGYPSQGGVFPGQSAFAAGGAMAPMQFARPGYSYSVAYSPYQPFVIPVGLPPHLVEKMMQASYAFRVFDRDQSGYLDKREWKKALRHMGYNLPPGYAKMLFYSVDTNMSGKISEREFCEWWITNFPY